MKMRRVVVSFEVETNVPARAFKNSTIWLSAAPHNAKIEYLEQPHVNVIRASTKARGKNKRKA